MVRGQTEYFMYDIAEIHTILEDALRPVFRIDRTEKKKAKILRKNKGCFDNLEDITNNPLDDNGKPAGMSSESDDEDDLLDQLSMSTSTKPTSHKDKKSKQKMIMINKRMDELMEVLDQCIADLHAESKILSKLKNALKTI